MTTSGLSRLLGSALRALLRPSGGAARSTTTHRTPRPGRDERREPPRPGRGYPGDHHGPLRPVYAPHPDGRPDPGEIVWTWVPYEEDHSQGKDRPVLLVGHDGPWLLGLMLSSRDHDARPSADGRWLDLGVGDWDARGRPSEVRLDRVLRIDPGAVRRAGAVLDRARFDEVAGSLGRTTGW